MRHSLLFAGVGTPLSQMVETARAAESEGMHGVYCVEAYRSGFVPLAAIAAATSNITIGPYILNAYGRTPFITGLSAIDLDELCGGRLVLGIGNGNGNVHINRRFQGLESERPLAKMREYVEIVRRMVRTPRGGSVTYSGKVHQINWTAHVKPVRSSIPVWMSAISPKMITTAAAVADGIAMGVLFSPEYIRERVRPPAWEAAAAAGRDPKELSFAMGALVAVDENLDRARTAIKATICSFYHPIPHPYYDLLLREHGFSQAADACARFVPIGDTASAMQRIEDAVVDRLAIVGTPAQCARRMAQYEGLIDEVIYLNAGGAGAANMCEAHRPIMEIRKSPPLK